MPLAETALPRALAELLQKGDFVVPPYPAAALRLRRVLAAPNFGLAEVADAAAADPALAAALLRVANSALYHAGGPPITTLGRAVHRLGARSVASIAVAAGIGAEACAPGPLVDLKYRVWRRAVTCALTSQKLASARGIDPEEAFLCGLLHGFGRSVALACLERLIANQPPPEPLSLIEWMQAVEPHRQNLARTLAEQWQLPDEITHALSGAETPPSPLSSSVHAADTFAEALERGASAETLLSTAPALEQRLLREFLGSLPAAMEALLESPDAPKRPRSANPSAVARPTGVVEKSGRPLSLSVRDRRSKKDLATLTTIAVSDLGLVLQADRPVQESSVLRLELGTSPAPTEAWFNVVLCVPERGHFRVEVQPFAPSRELRKLLAELGSASAGA